MVDKNKEFEKIINYSFKNNSLLTKSLTHKSFNNNINNDNIHYNYSAKEYSSNSIYLKNDNNNLFAKINLNSNLYDTKCDVVSSPKLYYDKPLNNLNRITIQLIDYLGRLIEINNEHNFVLEITEVKNILKDTLLDTNTNEVITTGYKR